LFQSWSKGGPGRGWSVVARERRLLSGYRAARALRRPPGAGVLEIGGGSGEPRRAGALDRHRALAV